MIHFRDRTDGSRGGIAGGDGEAGVKEDIMFLTRANGSMVCGILEKQQPGKGEKKKSSNKGDVKLEMPVLARCTSGGAECTVGCATSEALKEA